MVKVKGWNVSISISISMYHSFKYTIWVMKRDLMAVLATGEIRVYELWDTAYTKYSSRAEANDAWYHDQL